MSDAFAQAFTTRLVELSTANWEFWFGLLETYAKREGHAHVHQHHRENEMKLGVWVAVQRRLWVRGNLEPERANRLEALPEWTWDVEADAWENSFEKLQAFVSREGHARVPARHREKDFNLGTWVTTVRIRYARGTLDSERSARLEALPGWKWDPVAEDWEEGFSSLTRFIEREDHALVPTHHQEEAFKLGGWVSKQRTAHAEDRLDDQREARLEALPGWVWNTASHAWEEGYSNLVAYAAREGHALVPLPHRDADHWLGLWVATQRSNYRKGRLDTQQIARLEGLPGWTWNPKDDAWESGYNKLEIYVAREGHCRVPNRHREGEYRLGAWVGQQRRQQRRGKLDPDRAARLEAVPGWTWNARAGDQIQRPI